MEKDKGKCDRLHYNWGMAVLRVIMCFMVVLCHYWDALNYQGILQFVSWMRVFAVSVFMLMSFVLVQKTLVSHDKGKIINRFKRLLIPQIGWTLIYWVVYYIIGRLSNLQLENGIKDMVYQMMFGHSQYLNPSMWYQVDLIYVTLFFLIIIVLCKKSYEFVIWSLALIAWIIQYTGVNMIWNNLPFEIKYPVGRFAEMIPIASLGFILASKNILEKMKKHKNIVAISVIVLIALIYKYDVFSELNGYGYQGIKQSVVAFAVLCLFYVMPFEVIENTIILKKVVAFISNYTLGIYCMHRCVGTLITIAIQHWRLGVSIHSFEGCIIIYCVSFIIAAIGNAIFKKTSLGALFN